VVAEGELDDLISDPAQRAALASLVERRVVFRNPLSGEYRALSSLLREQA